nr:unnamed protein product [Callosobruchus chinensis]
MLLQEYLGPSKSDHRYIVFKIYGEKTKCFTRLTNCGSFKQNLADRPGSTENNISRDAIESEVDSLCGDLTESFETRCSLRKLSAVGNANLWTKSCKTKGIQGIDFPEMLGIEKALRNRRGTKKYYRHREIISASRVS